MLSPTDGTADQRCTGVRQKSGRASESEVTLIYAVEDEVFLQAPRDVLEKVDHAVQIYARTQPDEVARQLMIFANSIRAYAQHLPEKQQIEEWLDT